MNKKDPITPGAIRDKVSQLQQELINLVNKQIQHKDAIVKLEETITQMKKKTKGEVVNLESEVTGHEKELRAVFVLMKEKAMELKNYEEPIHVKSGK